MAWIQPIGTTHLHNLLSRDTRQFAFANTYQVVNPHTFLTTEAANTRRFAWMVPKTRPMDAMELNFQVPQEDEFAPCLMSLRSIYQALGLDGYDSFEPDLRAYVDSLKNYQKNSFTPLDPAAREMIAREWKSSFDAWSYPY